MGRITRRSQIESDLAVWLRTVKELERALNQEISFGFDGFTEKLSGSRGNRTRAIKAAELARSKLKLQFGSPTNMTERFESAGINVFSVDFGDNEIDGLSVARDDGGPAILLNKGRACSNERRRFTLAHELGHVLLHGGGVSFRAERIDGLGIVEDLIERQANWFAADFLVPKRALVRNWEKSKCLAKANQTTDALLERVHAVKQYFGVSNRMLIIRLIESHLASEDLMNSFLRKPGLDYVNAKSSATSTAPTARSEEIAHNLNHNNELENSKETNRNEYSPDLVSDRLWYLVYSGLKEKRISITQAAEILGANSDELRQLI